MCEKIIKLLVKLYVVFYLGIFLKECKNFSN